MQVSRAREHPHIKRLRFEVVDETARGHRYLNAPNGQLEGASWRLPLPVFDQAIIETKEDLANDGYKRGLAPAELRPQAWRSTI